MLHINQTDEKAIYIFNAEFIGLLPTKKGWKNSNLLTQ